MIRSKSDCGKMFPLRTFLALFYNSRILLNMKLIFITLLSLLLYSCSEEESSVQVSEKMLGVCLVAPPKKFSQDPMPDITKVGSGWVAVVPYSYTSKGKAELHFNTDSQWWGERQEGIEESVKLAKGAGLQVLLKPHVWVRGSWVGALDYSSSKEWEAWESDYYDYIMFNARLASSMKVEALCVGTELKISVQKREAFWRKLIKDVREVYSGRLLYAANWDEYPLVPFWDDLDYIGVDAYFPLSQEKTPSIETLKKEWEPVVKSLQEFSSKQNRPIVFSEFGYLSLDGCTHNTWALEKKRKETPINELAQANAYEALFEVFWEKKWWAGGLLWKWYPDYNKDNPRRAYYYAGDYTPQEKESEVVIRKWYTKEDN